MTFLFISHATPDKEHLAPFLEALLKELGEDVELWIDTPEEIKGFARRDNPRIRGIRPGEDWYDEIRHGLKQGGCVLFFLSERALAASDILWREFYEGLKQNRLVPVNLDGLDVARFPRELKANNLQTLDVSKFGTADDDHKFGAVIDQIRAVLDSRVRVDVGWDELPYLINRQAVSEVAADVRDSLEDADKPHSPAVYLVSGCIDDCLDMFSSRLVIKDGPEMCGLSSDKEHPGFVHEGLPLAENCPRERFHERFERINRARIERRLRQSLQRRRPLCFYTEFSLEDGSTEELDAIAEWVRYWEDGFPLLQQKIIEQLSTSSRNDLHEMPVIALLNIELERDKLWSYVERLGARKHERLKSLRHIRFEALPRLGLIKREHARDWAGKSDLERRGMSAKAREFVRDPGYKLFPKGGLFSKKRKAITMAAFRDELVRAPFWKKDK